MNRIPHSPQPPSPARGSGSLLSFLCSLGCLAWACGPAPEPAAEPAMPATTAHESPAVHWGYEGDTGPEHWGKLSADFAICGEGQEQSPIDLRDARVVEGNKVQRELRSTVLTMDERAHVMDLIDNGHTIQITNDVPAALDLDDQHFELVQYHFHAPSEHTVDGEHAPLEVHFVHKSKAGRLAVFAVFVEEGAHDPIWDPVLAALPSEEGDARHLDDLELNVDELTWLPLRYFRYEGSLTTPPCSQGVHWVVMAEPRQISADQMQAITSHLHDNNRPVQPVGEREIRLIDATDS